VKHRRRGRPKNPRRVEAEPGVTYFKPRGIPLSDLDVAAITVEELETLRLVDMQGMEQEEAASRMGISRRALWDELESARRKIAEALTEGKAIEIRGGDYVTMEERRFKCHDCGNEWEEPFGTGRPRGCPMCHGVNVHREVRGHEHEHGRRGFRRGSTPEKRRWQDG
jgi:predicted DNA-binding protein (UPF0251 family)